MKWSRKTFTFMVIPDANGQVVRFRLSALLLLSALALTAALAVLAAVAWILYGSRAEDVGRLREQLADAAGRYEQTVRDKDRRIGDLETEVAGLSDQARSIQDKMAELNDLELQMKEFAGIGGPEGEASAGAKELAAAGGADGEGGEDLPVSDQAVDSLVRQLSADFADMAGTIEELKPRLEETKAAVMKKQAELRVTPTIWPTTSRRITSDFGIRRDPFTRRATFHAGLDFGGDTGDPVYATADGTVVEAQRDGAHGNSIIVDHGKGIRTRYSHLSKILTSPGKKVRKGDTIGEVGSTGRSTGPHLHYEVFVGGENVDPLPYIPSSGRN